MVYFNSNMNCNAIFNWNYELIRTVIQVQNEIMTQKKVMQENNVHNSIRVETF